MSAAPRVPQATAVNERYIGKLLKKTLPRPQTITAVVTTKTLPTWRKLFSRDLSKL